jgi:(2Fe-2S) ferredoxin
MSELSPRKVLICQNRACRQQGAKKVLQAFQKLPVENVTVEATGCLGQCGNGPMVLVEPEDVWYCQVNPEEVPAVVERHLKGNQPIQAMLYKKFHHRNSDRLE